MKCSLNRGQKRLPVNRLTNRPRREPPRRRRSANCTRQSDPAAAEKRFKKFDVCRDGVVTRGEYLNTGAKKLK